MNTTHPNTPPSAQNARGGVAKVKTYVVRCYAGGSLLGSLMENPDGSPLQRVDARIRARQENEKAQRKAGGKSCFEFIVDSFEREP